LNAAAFSSAGFLAAALVGSLGPRFAVAARVLAGVSALLLVPGIDVPSSWPSLVLGAGAAALGSSLPCLLAAAGSLLVLLRPESASVAAAPALLALAAALAAGSLSSTLRDRLEEGAEASGLVAAAGAALVALLVAADGAAILRWGYSLGTGPARVEMRGAGLLLGLSLLACLGGTLLLVAHRLAPSVVGARALGFRLLLPGAALALLASAHVALQGLRWGRGALVGEAEGVAALLLLSGTLATGLGHVLRTPPPASPSSGDAWAARETALAVSVAWLAVAVGGWECWRSEGTYLCPRAATAAAAGLLGLGALAPAPLTGARRLLLLVALALAALFPEALG
jgi:hypothetical protein